MNFHAVNHRTLCGHPGAENAIARDLERIADRTRLLVGRQLVALVLVGSYGRGEGGIRFDDSGPKPDNDYDLVVVVRSHHRLWRTPLGQLGQDLSQQLGVHVDLWPVQIEFLQRAPNTLFWLDVSLASEVLTGDQDVLVNLPHKTGRQIPLEEIGRLLANRAAGLAISRLRSPEEDPRTLARHTHKAILACGDAWLIAANLYHGNAVYRSQQLQSVANGLRISQQLVAAYQDALLFRTNTTRWLQRTNVPDWSRSLQPLIARSHMEFEHWRIGSPLDPDAYARWNGAIFPELPDVLPAVRYSRQIAGKLSGGKLLQHPREKLARFAVHTAYSPKIDRESSHERKQLLTELQQLVRHGG